MENYSTEEYEREKLKKNEHFKSAVSMVRSVGMRVVECVYEESTYKTQERIPAWRRYGSKRYEDVRRYSSNEKEKYYKTIESNAFQFLSDVVGFFRQKNDTFISIPKYCYIWKEMAFYIHEMSMEKQVEFFEKYVSDQRYLVLDGITEVYEKSKSCGVGLWTSDPTDIWKQYFHKVVPQMFKKWEIETCKNEWN
jgi:hypothetical protein